MTLTEIGARLWWEELLYERYVGAAWHDGQYIAHYKPEWTKVPTCPL